MGVGSVGAGVEPMLVWVAACSLGEYEAALCDVDLRSYRAWVAVGCGGAVIGATVGWLLGRECEGVKSSRQLVAAESSRGGRGGVWRPGCRAWRLKRVWCSCFRAVQGCSPALLGWLRGAWGGGAGRGGGAGGCGGVGRVGWACVVLGWCG